MKRTAVFRSILLVLDVFSTERGGGSRCWTVDILDTIDVCDALTHRCQLPIRNCCPRFRACLYVAFTLPRPASSLRLARVARSLAINLDNFSTSTSLTSKDHFRSIGAEISFPEGNDRLLISGSWRSLERTAGSERVATIRLHQYTGERSREVLQTRLQTRVHTRTGNLVWSTGER